MQNNDFLIMAKEVVKQYLEKNKETTCLINWSNNHYQYLANLISNPFYDEVSYSNYIKYDCVKRYWNGGNDITPSGLGWLAIDYFYTCCDNIHLPSINWLSALERLIYQNGKIYICDHHAKLTEINLEELVDCFLRSHLDENYNQTQPLRYLGEN